MKEWEGKHQNVTHESLNFFSEKREEPYSITMSLIRRELNVHQKLWFNAKQDLSSKSYNNFYTLTVIYSS